MTARDNLAIVGAAVEQVGGAHRGKIDEIAFAATRRALRDAGVRAQDVGISVLASLDLYDGRGISNGIISPAAAGYLDNEVRLEMDASAAVVSAIAHLRARQAELAVVVAVSCPEIEADGPEPMRRFTDQVSSLTFDPHFARPLGMTATAALGMHAAAALERGETTLEDMADHAVAEIGRAAAGGRPVRRAVSQSDVLNASVLATPLTELMLPAESMAAIALVIGTEPRARRARQVRAWMTGWGAALTPAIDDARWLDDPFSTMSTAVEQAYDRAGLSEPSDEIDIVELTALTPALHHPALRALRLEDLPPDRVNPSGGVLGNFPGVANGALRIVEALEAMELGAGNGPRRAVVHSADNLMGPIASTSTVLVLEQP